MDMPEKRKFHPGELHNHYTKLIRNAGALVYGRATYQLMESSEPDHCSHCQHAKLILSFKHCGGLERQPIFPAG